MAIESINPATGVINGRYDEITRETARRIVAETGRAQKSWRLTSYDRRAELLRSLADHLRGNRDDYAALMAREMGKVVREGRSEVEKCAWVCEYYADNGEAFLSPEIIETEALRSYVTFQPLGTVLAVMPWNFPFWQVFRFAAPALMAGNACVLKHASNVPGCAMAMEQVVADAGFPKNLFRTLLMSGSRITELIADEGIAGVTLTGSTPAGRSIAMAAGKALKKCVLELGGSDPYVILADADLDKAVGTCVTSRLINGGQSCIAAKRFIVEEAIRDAFQERFLEKMKTLRFGDPMDETVALGPMARHDLRDALHRQVKASVEMGARCLLGGEIPDLPGAFYPPTILTDVSGDMPAGREELFGPVAAILSARDAEEAIEMANSTEFGLGAAIFSRDRERAEKIAAERLEAGCCFVNAFVRSDPRLPFGGIKASGFGRELSRFGIREFVNIKTVVVE